jgi:hypothetical protein
MAIDWMNPTEGEAEAKRIGYNEGIAENTDVIVRLEREALEQAARVRELEQEAADAQELIDGMMEGAKIRIADLEAEVAKLRAALNLAVRWADAAYADWDADMDSRVGKKLAALAGHLKNYAPDTDIIHAALNPKAAEAEGGDA